MNVDNEKPICRARASLKNGADCIEGWLYELLAILRAYQIFGFDYGLEQVATFHPKSLSNLDFILFGFLSFFWVFLLGAESELLCLIRYHTPQPFGLP